MPPSLDQDNTNTSSGTSQPSKLTSKTPSAGVQIPAKNARKNGTAKDNGSGGVLAAVTKNSSKLSNAKTLSPPNRLQSPEMQPANTTSNGNPITSPLLDALSSAASPPSATHNTNEWAKNVPAFSGSPSNLINLGESPPTLPSSYEDRISNFGWRTREQRVPNNPSASPPGRRRPISYHLDGIHAHGTDDHQSQSSPYAARRSSMYSQYSRYGQQPPLPHQAQAHFYGAPDPSLLLSPQMPGLIPGENGYYCGFDNLPSSSYDSSKVVDNVIIAGYEGGLDIYAVTKRALNRIARIDGLRGGVYNAKILPANIRGTNSPLIAVVVQGPVWTSSDASGDFTAPPTEGIATNQTENIRGSPRFPATSFHDNDSLIEYYQTTVEVYSLNTKQHVATLLSLPKTRLVIPTTNPLFRAPPPVGSLNIRAGNAFIVVASGTTGETWIFDQGDFEGSPKFKFRCIGKVWTTVQQGLTVDSTGLQGLADGDWHSTDLSLARQQFKASILSLNGRWLAFCPSAPSSQISLRAAVLGVLSTAKVPGLNGQAPPQLPPVNCGVETPGGESIVKQLAQQATQELVKGATYIGKQGVQAWNNYWNKPSTTQSSHTGPFPTHSNIAHQFPPTHGVSSQAPVISKDPGLVSIIDLNSLAQHASSTGAPPHPFATFKIPHGCSFLSFSPSGLALFTASSKGDMQFVWDLMRLQYAKPSFLKNGPQGSGIQGPHVRQIAHFSRMTIARIVDVVWTSPHGERAAMVTEPGTVHILDLPASAFTWPAPRRRLISQRSGDDGRSTSLTATGVASNAVNSLWTAARPLVSRKRRSSTGISAISAASVSSQAGHGTQALAAGISRSVGAATGRMNEMRKSGSTKLHLPRSATTPTRACIRLSSGKHNDSILVVGGGIVGFYTVKSRKADRPADKQKATRGAKYTEYRLPSLPDIKIAPDMTRDLPQAGDLEPGEQEVEQPRRRQPQAQAIRPRGAESSIPQAEIESNAPYQPFHTDRRVGLYIFSCKEILLPSPSVSALLSPVQVGEAPVIGHVTRSNNPWAFGGAIKATKLDVGPPQYTEDSFYAPSDHRALPPSAIERVMKITDSHEDVEQIVVTTRIRKSIRSESSGDLDEEGFFEDDCEVLDFASQRV